MTPTFSLSDLQAAFKSGQMLGENAMGIIENTKTEQHDINYGCFNSYVESQFEIDVTKEL